MKTTRKYEMVRRAESAAQTRRDILRVLGELWLQLPLHEITLEKIAAQTGTSVRTILRQFGSREGMFEAAIGQDVAGIVQIKQTAETGNIPQLVSVLMTEYEGTGDAAIRTLALEYEMPVAAKILQRGREIHTAWCARVFAPFLPAESAAQYAVRLGAFYAATDVYAWKLLRKDLGYSTEETAAIFRLTLEGLVLHFTTNKP